LFLALALAAEGSASASVAAWLGALGALWSSAWAMPGTSAGKTSPLGLCVAALAIWIAGSNFFANPSYTPAAPYHAAFLFGGYLFGLRAVSERGRIYATGLAFGVALAGWALWQQISQGEQRAHGLFITPAALAAALNLLLVPGLVLVALGERRWSLVAALSMLTIALAASLSRGGWLALLAAGGIAFVFARRARLTMSPPGVPIVAAVLLLGCGAGWLLNMTMESTALGASVATTQPAASFHSRLELYALAVSGIRWPDVMLGNGYQSFYYLLETGREAVPSYTGKATYFVHDDYLQTLLELGIPGLAGLLLLVIVPFRQCWRAIPAASPGEQRALVAVIAAIASMAIHALADFPFFIPFCILMYCVALGLLDASCSLTRSEELRLPNYFVPPAPARRIVVAAVGTIAAWILLVPAAAEAAAAYAEKQWRAANGERAAYWFEVARRLDPRDWRYHWYAGQFWTAQAQARGDPASARLADTALAAAQAANSREVRPLYSRILLHTRLRKVLANPVDAQTLRAWAAHAAELAPTDPGVLAGKARVFEQFPVEGGK